MNLSDSALRTHIENHGSKFVFTHLIPRERWMECDADGCSKWLCSVLSTRRVNSDPFIKILVQSGISLKLPRYRGIIFDYEFDLSNFEAICERIDTFVLPCRQNNWLAQLLSVRDVPERMERVHIVMKYGARLSSIDDDVSRYYITPQLYIFERCILRCRRAVITLLKIKKKIPQSMWDRYLLKYIARLIWATRCDPRRKSYDELEYEKNDAEYQYEMNTKKKLMDAMRDSIDTLQTRKDLYDRYHIALFKKTAI